MKTMLVPLDLTATTENAVNFAAAWSKRYGYDHIILFKTFYESMFEHLVLGADYTIANKENLNKLRDEGIQYLEDKQKELAAKLNDSITVTTATSELPLLQGIFEILRNEEGVELIVLGSDNHTGSHNSFISSNIISIAKASPVKVLIVPSDHTYQLVKNVLVPCDINDLTAFDKLDRIKNNAKPDGTHLLILNVNKKGVTDENTKDKEDHLHRYLKDFPHEIYTVTDKDVINGILSFADHTDHDIQLIIALPGKHSFFYSLTNKSISEGIYRNARLPVMILK